MAYTIPEYVDTPEQAILAVASAVKGEQVTGGDGSVNTALDILADTLAETDVQVPQTAAGAILALAQYVPGGGGGGGVEVGAPTLVVSSSTAPEVGDYLQNDDAIAGITIGEAIIVPTDPYNRMPMVASGATATTRPDVDLSPTACAAYVATVAEGEITAVEPWGGTLTQWTWTSSLGDELNVWSFTIPALEFDIDTGSGQVLCLYMH